MISLKGFTVCSSKLCNHDTGLLTNIILQAVFEYLDPGKFRENFVFYNSQKANKDETRGQNRMLTTIQ